MQTEKNRVRQKRVRLQQNIITAVCLALIVFVFTWLINTAVTGRKNGLMPVKKNNASASAQADPKSKIKKKNDKASDSKTDAETKDDNKTSESKAENTDASEDGDKPYENAAMKDDFSDACFIGDSRTVGLEMNCDKAKADFYASTGLNIGIAMTEPVVLLDNGNYGTVVEGAAQKEYKRIFIMFGINELGWPYPETFVEEYVELINAIKEVQPNADIYIESVLPVSYKAVETNEVFTNENIDAFNEYVKQAAELTGTNYLDINPYFKDESGSLPEDAAADGIHFIRDYCLEWIDLLAYLVPAAE